MKKQLMNIERDIKILELKKKLLKERLKRKVF
jgi:hypothetical protein